MGAVSDGVEQLKTLNMLSEDTRIAAFFSRIEAEAASDVSYHVVTCSATDYRCYICRELLKEDISIMECGDAFHKACIERYLNDEPEEICASCDFWANPSKYPWILDDLFEHSKRKCHTCGEDLCDGRSFHVRRVKSPDATSDESSLFCSECIAKEGDGPAGMKGKRGLWSGGWNLKFVCRTSKKC